MDNFENICYKRNFLDNVIVRLDFDNSENVFSDINETMLQTILQYFPVIEKREIQSGCVTLSPTGISHSESKPTTQWLFWAEDRKKLLSIDNNAFVITYEKYEKFEDLKKDFIDIFSQFVSIYPQIKFNRFGLRFINNIFLSEKNPFAWNSYFDSKLTNIFKVHENKEDTTRIINSLEYKQNDYDVRLVYGMPNPDYPAKIKKKMFLLDFDVYYKGIIDNADMENYLMSFHSTIQKSFESMIKPKFRELLNAD